jgi:hypothetical protein
MFHTCFFQLFVFKRIEANQNLLGQMIAPVRLKYSLRNYKRIRKGNIHLHLLHAHVRILVRVRVHVHANDHVHEKRT